jgi:hypothetical protein
MTEKGVREAVEAAASATDLYASEAAMDFAG